MNTWHKPARAPQIPSTRTPCTYSVHRYQNKGFARQNSKFLSPLFSHRYALSHPQALCFDILHKNARGEGVTSVTTVDSRIGRGSAARWEEERSFDCAARRAIIRRAGKNRAAPLRMTEGEGGMTARRGADRLRRRPLQGQEEPRNRSEDRPLRERELSATSDQRSGSKRKAEARGRERRPAGEREFEMFFEAALCRT